MALSDSRHHRVGRPTIEEAEQLRLRIVDAALRVFVRDGINGAAMDEIARNSGTTRRSVAHRFPTKEALFVAIIESHVGFFMSVFQDARQSEPDEPLAALRRLSRSLLDVILTPDVQLFYRLLVAEAARFPLASEILIRWNDRLVLDLEDLIARVQLSGAAFRDKEPWAVATSLVGVFISNPVNRKTLGDREFYDPQALERYFDRLWAMIIK